MLQSNISKIECPRCNEFLELKESEDGYYFQCPEKDCLEEVAIKEEFKHLDVEDLLDSEEDICDYC